MHLCNILFIIVSTAFFSLGIVIFATEDTHHHGLRMEEQGYNRGVQDMASFMTTDTKLAHKCLNEWKQEVGNE